VFVIVAGALDVLYDKGVDLRLGPADDREPEVLLTRTRTWSDIVGAFTPHNFEGKTNFLIRGDSAN
jgi:hypothetical protein